MKCSICLSTIMLPYQLQCGCQYHKQCLQEYCNSEVSKGVFDIGIFCPKCYAKNKQIKIHPRQIMDLLSIYNVPLFLNNSFYYSKKLWKQNTKKEKKTCPTCNSYIMKIDGCQQVSCIRCKTKFCYQCLSTTLQCNCDTIE